MEIAVYSRSGTSLQYLFAQELSQIPNAKITLINIKITHKNKFKIAIKLIKKIGISTFIYFLISKELETRLMNKRIDKSKTYKILEYKENDLDLIEFLRGMNFKLICVGQSGVISKRVLTSTTGLWLNIHPAQLPKYRGYAEPANVIYAGDFGNLGATIHKVNTGIDDGDILYWHPMELSKFNSMNLNLFEARMLGIRKMRDLILSGELFTLAEASQPQPLSDMGFSQILNWKKRLTLDIKAKINFVFHQKYAIRKKHDQSESAN